MRLCFTILFYEAHCQDVIIRLMKCDTCGKETDEVRRVVIDTGYDRTLAKPCYNCAECYEKKEAEKKNRLKQS